MAEIRAPGSRVLFVVRETCFFCGSERTIEFRGEEQLCCPTETKILRAAVSADDFLRGWCVLDHGEVMFVVREKHVSRRAQKRGGTPRERCMLGLEGGTPFSTVSAVCEEAAPFSAGGISRGVACAEISSFSGMSSGSRARQLGEGHASASFVANVVSTGHDLEAHISDSNLAPIGNSPQH